MDIEEAIKICKTLLKVKHEIYFTPTDKVAIEKVLQELENSIPKKKIKYKINKLRRKRGLSLYGMGQLEGLYELLYELSEEKQQKMKYYTKHDLNKLILDCNEGHNLVNYILKLQDLLEEK